MNTLVFDAVSRASLRLEARLEFLRLLRTPGFSVPVLLFPLMFFLLFGVLLANPRSKLQVTQYLLATYSVFGVMGPGLFGFGVSVANERDRGLLALRRALPMPALNYVGSKLAMALCFSSIIFVLLALAGAGIGGVRLAWGQWLLLGLVVVPGVLPFCALGLLVASFCSGQAAPAVINLIYLPMALLAGLWLPLSVLPAVFQTMAPLWPAWHVAQLALAAMAQPSQGTLTGHLLYLLTFTVACGAWAARRLQREP